MKTVKYVISGRVQGVGFRWFTKEKARSLNVHGSVKNCFDGTVEVIAQADEETLSAFEKELHLGPATARVDRVNTDVVESKKQYESFEVAY